LYGDLIASWVRTDEDLRWLAPGTPPPLTGPKIAGWRKPGGSSLVAFEGRSAYPVCYGELNPMRHEADHYWIGHVIVDPALRSCGIGKAFVRLLLSHAFGTRAARKVSLVVFPDNRAAIHCYESCGFRRVGDESHRFAPGGGPERLLRFEAGPAAIQSRSSSQVRRATAPR
jgi:RimJ/RimL family protein N-acetyltransferase